MANKRNEQLKQKTDTNVKKLVEEGYTSREISDILNINFSTVARSIKRQGLTSNKKRKIKCTIKQEEEIISLYENEYMTCEEIQPLYPFLSVDQVNYIVRKNEKTRRNGKRVYFNQNYFESIDSEDKAYFLGLLFADGSVQVSQKSENGFSHLIVIELNTTDKEILRKFNKCIENKREVYDYQRLSEEYKGETHIRNMSKVTLYSKKMFDDLSALGKQPIKVDTCVKVPDIPQHLLRHFIRGYFDGDGSVTVSNGSIALHIYGTHRFLNSYKEKLESLGIRVNNQVHDKKDINVSMLSINTKSEIEKIYSLFYKDANFYIKRRKVKFEELF